MSLSIVSIDFEEMNVAKEVFCSISCIFYHCFLSIVSIDFDAIVHEKTTFDDSCGSKVRYCPPMLKPKRQNL